MNFFVIGVNHKTAPVEVRERFAIPEEPPAGSDEDAGQLSRDRRGNDCFYL